jgi:hypothetical protein
VAWSRTEFNIDDLHPPLNALLSTNYDPVESAREHKDMLDLILEDLPELVPQAPTFFLPEERPQSLIICVLYLIHHQVPEANLIDEFVEKLVEYMLALDDLNEIFTNDDAEALREGADAFGMNEIYAIAHMLHWSIRVSTIDEHCKIISDVVLQVSDKPECSVYLQQMGNYFTSHVKELAYESDDDV